MKEQLKKSRSFMLSLGIIVLIAIVLYIAISLMDRVREGSNQPYDDAYMETINLEDNTKPISTIVEQDDEENYLMTENSQEASEAERHEHKDALSGVDTEAEISDEKAVKDQGKLIVIDAGHQSKGNYEKEQIGPGAKTKKAKVSSGTTGINTGLQEYKLNLIVSMKLKEELLRRGYQVKMIRETNQVNISNAERAYIANEAKADAFLRIHGNSSEDSKVKGAMTICQTKANPYNSDLYQVNKKLSEVVIESLIEKTGAVNRGVWETDTMSGINWCTVPVTIIEMGYLSNQEEDKLLATESYQDKIVQGIADGLDAFFEED